MSAWKAGGSQWKAWSSRLVTATLETGKGKSGRLHVLSCYASTFAASIEEKDKFFDLHQDALSAFPSRECYVILGDFNTRVGSRAVDDNDWWYCTVKNTDPENRIQHTCTHMSSQKKRTYERGPMGKEN